MVAAYRMSNGYFFYQGGDCEVHTDICVDSPCHPSSTCSVDMKGGFVCHCPETREGQYCEYGRLTRFPGFSHLLCWQFLFFFMFIPPNKHMMGACKSLQLVDWLVCLCQIIDEPSCFHSTAVLYTHCQHVQHVIIPPPPDKQ